MPKQKNIIIIGGGLLGIEVANSLLNTGANITIVEFFDYLLPRQLDADGSELLSNLLKQKVCRLNLAAQQQVLMVMSPLKA